MSITVSGSGNSLLAQLFKRTTNAEGTASPDTGPASVASGSSFDSTSSQAAATLQAALSQLTDLKSGSGSSGHGHKVHGGGGSISALTSAAGSTGLDSAVSSLTSASITAGLTSAVGSSTSSSDGSGEGPKSDLQTILKEIEAALASLADAGGDLGMAGNPPPPPAGAGASSPLGNSAGPAGEGVDSRSEAVVQALQAYADQNGSSTAP